MFWRNPVFLISLAICLPIGAWGVASPDSMTRAAVGFTDFAISGATWYWLLLCTGLVALSAFLALGPYGKIRLGGDDERPEFSTASWIAMLFSGGMGAGLLFWGVAEPVTHFASPPVQPGGTPAAAREAMIITNLHWGFHAWAIYGICGLVIAYFGFRKGKSTMISTPVRAALPGPAGRAIGPAADVLGVIAVVFGLAGSLSMGALQLRAGLDTVFHVPPTQMSSALILLALYLAYMVSASTGVEKGIKVLADLNFALAIGVMLYILAFGPTLFILETFIDTLGSYPAHLLERAFRLYPYEGRDDWSVGWTLTYLIWWLAWGPFVGIFIARISRGRTIREFCAGVILVPTLFSILWFAAFGGTAIYIELFGPGGLAELVSSDVSEALFSFYGFFFGGKLLSTVSVVLIFVFLVTSANSGTFVLAMMTSNGALNPANSLKFVWGTLIAAITCSTLFTGSVDVARSMAAIGAIPFSLILIVQVIGLMRALRTESRSPEHTAKAAE